MKQTADYWRRKRERMRRVAREFVKKCRERGIDPYAIGTTGRTK